MLTLDEIKRSKNVAELLEDSDLHTISQQVLTGYRIDEESRGEWLERVNAAMGIAKQTMETKNTPFPNAANVKYPLITQACIDFAARLYPELLRNDKVVKTSVVGQDKDQARFRRAQRIAEHMSYQILNQVEGWEDSLDKLLHILPVVGTVFKKTYYDPIRKVPASELCLPEKICVNYATKSLKEARRITHVLCFSRNDVVERVRRGFYRDVDVDDMLTSDDDKGAGAKLAERLQSSEDADDFDGMITLLEQQCYLDLDEDGYLEPYVVTVHEDSGTVLRIINRFTKIEKNGKGEVACIYPEQYFTDYHFLRSPDGGYYSVGLGTLLYPINAAINSIINQLLDAGTMANSQGGLIGKGLRLKGGTMKLAFNEWKQVDAAPGSALRDNVFPMPSKEPSPTLFQLLGLLIQVGKDLIYTTEAMKGQGETQNVAATTVLAMIEQGMKVYNSIAKRIYRSMKEEFAKIAEINERTLTQAEYMKVLNDPAADVKVDYAMEDLDVLPIADPAMSSMAQRLAKLQAMVQVPGLDRYETGVLYLQALQIDDDVIARILPKPDPNAPPPPEAQAKVAQAHLFMAQAEAEMASIQMGMGALQAKMQELELAKQQAEVAATEAMGRVSKMQSDTVLHAQKIQHAREKTIAKVQLDEIKTQHAIEKDHVDTQLAVGQLGVDVAKVKVDHEKVQATKEKSHD